MAGCCMSRGHGYQLRSLSPAASSRYRAAAVEGAAARRVARVGNITAQNDLPPRRVRIRVGRGGKERLGVGMVRRVVDQTFGADLDDATQIHYGHSRRDMAHDGEIMGDE